jgi:Ca2+-binding RTX toxin-like protein
MGLLGGLNSLGFIEDVKRPPVYVINPVWVGRYPSSLNPQSPFVRISSGAPATFNNASSPQYAFSAETSKQYDARLNLVTYPNSPTPYLGAYTPELVSPRLADTSDFIARSLSGDLYLNNTAYQNEKILVRKGDSFSAIGALPGIADDGSLVAFAGKRGQDEIGVFVADPRTGSIRKVVGISNDGRLDLNERFVDQDGDGIFDANGTEDVGSVLSIELDSQVNISHPAGIYSPLGDKTYDPRFFISFNTTTSSPKVVQGLGLARLTVSQPGQKPEITDYTSDITFEGFEKVVSAGDYIPGVGNVQSIKTHDALDFEGNVAFWARGDKGTGVVVAKPKTIDVSIRSFTNILNDESPNRSKDSAGLNRSPNTSISDKFLMNYQLEIPEQTGEPEDDFGLIFELYASSDSLLQKTDKKVGELILSESTGMLSRYQGAVTANDSLGVPLSDAKTLLTSGSWQLSIDPLHTGTRLFFNANSPYQRFDDLLRDRSVGSVLAIVKPFKSNGVSKALLSQPEVAALSAFYTSQEQGSTTLVIRSGGNAKDDVKIQSDKSINWKNSQSIDLSGATMPRFESVLAFLGDGDDTFDALEAGELKTEVYGGFGDDALAGTVQSDQLFGQGGNDILVGNAGDDHLDGDGTKTDKPQVSLFADTDLIFGDLPILTFAKQGNLPQPPQTPQQVLYFGRDLLVLLKHGNSKVVLDRYIESITETASGNDVLLGGNGRNLLVGGPGSDRIFSGWVDYKNIDKIRGTEGRTSFQPSGWSDSPMAIYHDATLSSGGIILGDSFNIGFVQQTARGTESLDFANLLPPAPTAKDSTDPKSSLGRLTSTFMDQLRLINGPQDAGGNDLILGSSGNDWISGGSKGDEVYALQGDDYVFGGDGDDLLDGGKGTDVLVAGFGADGVFAGSGTLTDSSPNMVIGTDAYWTSSAMQLVVSNLIEGVFTFPSDFLQMDSKEDGENFLVGSNARDFIIGGNNRDFIEAGAGNDLVYGDAVQFGYLKFANANDFFGNFFDLVEAMSTRLAGTMKILGSVTDVVSIYLGASEINAGEEGINFNDALNIASIILTIGGPLSPVLGLTGTAIGLLGAAIDPYIKEEQGGDDLILGGSGTDYLYGLKGDDTIFAGSATNGFLGEPAFQATVDNLSGNLDDDFLYSSSFTANLRLSGLEIPTYGPIINPALSGYATMLGGLGNDHLFGGYADGVLLGDASSLPEVGKLLKEAEQEIKANPLEVYGYLDFLNDSPQPFKNDDYIEVSNGNVFIVGGYGSDTITTGKGDNYVLGDYTIANPISNPDSFNLRDLLENRIWREIHSPKSQGFPTSKDIVQTRGGKVVAALGPGDDELFYLSDPWLYELLVVSGDEGADTIKGRAEQNLIIGGDDEDQIELNFAKTAYVIGDRAAINQVIDLNKTFTSLPGAFDGVRPLRLINEFDGPKINDPGNVLNGASGNDTIRVESFRSIILGGAGDDLIGTFGNSLSYNLIFGDSYDIHSTPATIYFVGNFVQPEYDIRESVIRHNSIIKGDDWIVGSNYFDVVYGGGGNDNIFGWQGADYLYGQSGNDVLIGGNYFSEQNAGFLKHDHDYLFGGSGNDELDGGVEFDSNFGQHGRDTYFFYISPRENFELEFSDYDRFEDLQYHDVTFANGQPSNTTSTTWAQILSAVYGTPIVTSDQHPPVFPLQQGFSLSVLNDGNARNPLKYDPPMYVGDISTSRVAILDTGIDTSVVNAILGPDLGDEGISSLDYNGHGTEVAWLLDRSLRPSRLVHQSSNIVAIKVTSGSSSTASLSSIYDALVWTLENHVRENIVAINLSLGMNLAETEIGVDLSVFESIFRKLYEANVFIAVAAGNDFYSVGPNVLNVFARSEYVAAIGAVYPADVGPQSYASGAKDFTTAKNRMASFTQRGNGLDLLAYGAQIPTVDRNGKSTYRSGTSFAVPQVAAAATYLREMADRAGYKTTPRILLELLQQTGTPIFDGDDEDDNVANSNRSYSLLNVRAAVTELERRIQLASPARSLAIVNQGAVDHDTFTPRPAHAIPLRADTSDLTTNPVRVVIPMGSPGLDDGSTNWSFNGNGNLNAPHDLLLTEHNTLISNAQRDYTLNPSKRFFKFEIHDLVLANNGPDVPTDAFEAALGITKNGTVNYVNRITAIARTDGLLNIQQDGTYYAGPGVTVTGTIVGGNKMNLAEPIFVSVDISNLPAGTVGTLGFDLIGFGNANSSVRIVVPEGPSTQNSIAGFVYEDANDNGLFDSGEKPISGVTVTLSGDAARSMVTGSDGAYRFDGLLDGLYTIAQTQPVLYNDGRETQGSPVLGLVQNDRFVDVLLENDTVATGYNFGELPIAATDNSISGYVYLDADNDGVFDANEQPIEGATIHLFGPVSSSFTTRRDGLFTFTSLPSGLYRVVQTQPTGYDDGRETQGTPATGSVSEDRFVNLALTSNMRLVNYNFGERPLSVPQPNSIAGAVYLDTNNNGVYDTSEKPLAGVVIQLNGPVTRTYVTAADGTYQFTDLPSGTYTLTQEQPDGYEDGPETRGTPALGTLENDRFVDMNLSGGINGTGYHFAERPIATGTSFVTGWVYLDRNQNSRRDADEPGLNKVELRLSGPVSRTVYTNDIGQFAFTDLPAGTYTVTQVQPEPYNSVSTRVGSSGGTADGDVISAIVLNGTSGGSNYSFGEFPKPKPSYNSIGGLVYLDANNNGRRDASERVIPGITITLVGPVNRSVVTDIDGVYAFVNLPDGVYSVYQTQSATFIDGLDTLGSPQSGISSNDRFENISLASNAVLIQYNFGESAIVDPSQLESLTAIPAAESILLAKMRGDGERWQPSTGPQSLGHNQHYYLDPDNDGYISPLDVLLLINCINSDGMSLGATRVIAGYTTYDGRYLDIDGDRFLSPLDVLMMINYLNSDQNFQVPGDGGESGSGGGEGESVAFGPEQIAGVDWSWNKFVPYAEPVAQQVSDSIIEVVRYAMVTNRNQPSSFAPEGHETLEDVIDDWLAGMIAESNQERKNMKQTLSFDEVFSTKLDGFFADDE